MTVEGIRGAAFAVERDGRVVPNASATRLRSITEEIDAANEMLDVSWAGATIAALFRREPWLDSMNMEVSGQEGSVPILISNVIPIGMALTEMPEELFDEDGIFDPDSAAERLMVALEDCEADLLRAFGGDDHATIEVDVNRSAIEDLLERPQLDGAEAFSRLFPEYAHLGRLGDDGAA